jgi:hypothetical protein
MSDVFSTVLSPPALSHLETSRAVLGLAAAARAIS